MICNLELISNLYRRYMILIIMPIAALLSGCEVELARGLSDDVSLRLLTDLAEGGIVASRYLEGKGKEPSWSVHVDNNSRQGAISILSRLKPLVERDSQSGSNESILGNAESHRDSRLGKIALSLEQSLERLPRVREARVHLSYRQPMSLSTSDLSADGSGSDSAAVLITTYPQADIKTEDVSRLVSGATGISQSSIVVVVNELPLGLFKLSDSKDTQGQLLESLGKSSYTNIFMDAKVLFAVFGLIITLAAISHRVIRTFRPIRLIVDEKC